MKMRMMENIPCRNNINIKKQKKINKYSLLYYHFKKKILYTYIHNTSNTKHYHYSRSHNIHIISYHIPFFLSYHNHTYISILCCSSCEVDDCRANRSSYITSHFLSFVANLMLFFVLILDININ